MMIKSMWVNLERIKPLRSANDPVLGRFGKNTTMDLKTRPARPGPASSTGNLAPIQCSKTAQTGKNQEFGAKMVH